MDEDSSTKFIGSLTKFLQSLCNGYVEFQRGVELVGHIYLSIDTGEKVDYILHEKVSKNDENSVSFVSNSFHAQPTDKKDRTGKRSAEPKGGDKSSEQVSDDDDIMIVDQSERIQGSTDTGTVPNRSYKRAPGPGFDSRLAQHSSVRLHNQNHGSSSPLSSQSKYRQQYGTPSATVTNQNMQQDNISIGDVKLEQLSADELLSLASQVDEGASSSHAHPEAGQRSHARHGSQVLDSSSGQPVWIKQEAADDSQSQGGHDTGWPRSRDGQSDSSNSGSDLYPVMMHQNPAYSSGPVFPGQSSTSGSVHLGHSQKFPAMSGAASPFANPGTSQGMSGIDPAVTLFASDSSGPFKKACTAPVFGRSDIREYRRHYMRHYRQSLKQNPSRLQHYRERERIHKKTYLEKKKRYQQMLTFQSDSLQ